MLPALVNAKEGGWTWDTPANAHIATTTTRHSFRTFLITTRDSLEGNDRVLQAPTWQSMPFSVNFCVLGQALMATCNANRINSKKLNDRQLLSRIYAKESV